MMIHLTQPDGSNLCGQTCLAMILWVSIPKAIAMVGKRGRTRTRDLRHVLEENGYECTPRLKLGAPSVDGLFILKVRYDDRKNTHWVVLLQRGEKASYYDPCFSREWHKLPHGRVSSHMRVSKRVGRCRR